MSVHAEGDIFCNKEKTLSPLNGIWWSAVLANTSWMEMTTPNQQCQEHNTSTSTIADEWFAAWPIARIQMMYSNVQLSKSNKHQSISYNTTLLLEPTSDFQQSNNVCTSSAAFSYIRTTPPLTTGSNLSCRNWSHSIPISKSEILQTEGLESSRSW